MPTRPLVRFCVRSVTRAGDTVARSVGGRPGGRPPHGTFVDYFAWITMLPLPFGAESSVPALPESLWPIWLS